MKKVPTDQAMNVLLANACPANEVNGVLIFKIDLCCVTATINATRIPDSENDYSVCQYNIISIDFS